jgi:hypothetical protein
VTLTTAAMAFWLANNVSAIACDEAAGLCFTEVQNAVDAIERMINRPHAAKYCGNCPAPIEDKHGHQQVCAIPLYAEWDYRAHQYPVEIECWRCKAAHNVDRLIEQALNSVAGLLYSAGEIQALMEEIGQPIPPRTWRYWRAEGKIAARSWRDGEPMYWINDVRDLMAQKPQKLTTGAAARRTG